MASERLSWGFSRGAKALAGSRRASDSLSAKARRALRAAPQVCPKDLDMLVQLSGGLVSCPQRWRSHHC